MSSRTFCLCPSIVSQTYLPPARITSISPKDWHVLTWRELKSLPRAVVCHQPKETLSSSSVLKMRGAAKCDRDLQGECKLPLEWFHGPQSLLKTASFLLLILCFSGQETKNVTFGRTNSHVLKKNMLPFIPKVFLKINNQNWMLYHTYLISLLH